MFQKADFLNGGSGGTLVLGDGSKFTLTTSTSGITPTESNARGRWLVQSGGVYYLSSDTFSMDTGTHEFEYDPSSTWAVYTPSTSAGTVLNFTGSTFSTQTFNDVQSLGFYVESWNGSSTILVDTATSGDVYNMQVTDFNVDVVPEPNVSSLISLGVIAVLGSWRVRARIVARGR